MSTQTFDPWEKLRGITAIYTDVKTVWERYDKIKRLAVAQYQDLRDRKGTAEDTLTGLLECITFITNKADPLEHRLETLARQMEVETERINSGETSNG